MLSVAAGGLTLAALGVIYKSWRSQASTYLYLGLVVWLVAAVCWSYAQGWEFGVLYALCIPSIFCLLYTSPSPRDRTRSRMPSSA